MKNQRGITLIALVITIIVMLILVGVSVTVALNGGLFSTAQKATENTEVERDKEVALSEGKVEINGKLYNSVDEYVNGTTEYTAYSIGDEVTIGEEIFYVLLDSGKTEENVTLLAKDSIDTTNLVQGNPTELAFSSTNYWSSETEEYPYDLTETGEPDESHYAAYAAYQYGMKLGGTGRLMTYDEASDLVDELGGDIFSWDYFWLGTAASSSSLITVDDRIR